VLVLIVGSGLTVAVIVADREVPFVAVTVYVVVVKGLAVTDAAVVVDKPVDGAHEYIKGPVPVTVALAYRICRSACAH